MERRRVGWSELPPDLLSMIGNRLDSPLDVLGLRSVCNSWRSSFPLSNRSDPPPSPLKFPCPFAAVDAFVSESTIYRLEPVDEIENPKNPNPSSSSTRRSPSLPSRACLVRVEETKPGKLFPLFVGRLDDGAPVPNVLSLLNFRRVKLGKSNGLSFNNGSFCMSGVNKVIRNPNSASPHSENCSIFVIFDGGKLGFAMNGDRELTLVDDQNTDYNDIIVYRGKPCVVDKRGTVSWIDDLSLELTQLSPHGHGLDLDLDSGGWKHLVESGGELYVVDRYCEKIRIRYEGVDQFGIRGRRRFRRNGRLLDGGNTVGFRVYKLDEKSHKWVEVMNLGDKAFVLNDDISFSVSASEFDGCKANCIYYKDEINSNLFSFYRAGSNFFNLQDRTINPYRWSEPLCFSNLHLNTRIWLLDCFNYI